MSNAAILEFSGSALAGALGLPAGTVIDAVAADIMRPGIFHLRVHGPGLPNTQPGWVLQVTEVRYQERTIHTFEGYTA